jgi:dTMP kinase
MFITFEGIDLAGKTTQAQLLAKYLIDKGKKVITIREPGGTQVAEKIRHILLDPQNDLPPFAELFLFEAARADLVNKVIKPSLAKGNVVICDRFWDSTIAYQAFGRRLPFEFVEQCNYFASEGLTPNLTFFIDIPLDVLYERAKLKAKDRMEQEESEFLQRVINGFRTIAQKFPDRFIIIDGSKTIEEIHKIVTNYVEQFLEREK